MSSGGSFSRMDFTRSWILGVVFWARDTQRVCRRAWMLRALPPSPTSALTLILSLSLSLSLSRPVSPTTNSATHLSPSWQISAHSLSHIRLFLLYLHTFSSVLSLLGSPLAPCPRPPALLPTSLPTYVTLTPIPNPRRARQTSRCR
jgi:hypothetical protein